MSDPWDRPKEDLSHPDSAIRLASAVHRFRVPEMNPDATVDFAKSFNTVGKNPKTRKVMLRSDDQRKKLEAAGLANITSYERVVAEARRYQPFIHQVLVSCKFQPEMARLDQRLVFEWASGIESSASKTDSKKSKKSKYFKSEAMMFDLTMTIVSEGLGKAGVATESSVAGEFAAASREYAAATGIFQYLAEDHLPKWVARKASTADDEDVPVECCRETAEGLSILFQANAQQMAVATVLIKPTTPNYSLMAKLCKGIEEQLDEFIIFMREKSFKQMARIEKDFFTLVTFQIALQRALSLYFQARDLWDVKQEYGLAIAMLSEATVNLRTRESAGSPTGVPDVTKNPALNGLTKDLNDLREHMGKVLHSWEKDNSSVYFDGVPRSVPVDKKLDKGVRLNKIDKYHVADAEPLLLNLPEGALQRSDSDLARELQERLNSGLDD
mmetsp:Transcript_45581/g.110950  ORF Transcript_45581/g.110950 Transcript_45581/m.110950 type:complete len:442 (+) Transcript_45581:145-1470(+)